MKNPLNYIQEYPHRTKQKGESTSEQKARNKEFSRKGIFVEDVIRLVKTSG